MRNDSEPSVEEILESIKKVIARDNREIARPRRTPAAAPAEEPLHGTAPQTPAADDDFTFDDEEEDAVLDLAEDSMVGGAQDDTSLTTEASARSMRESLAALAMISEPSARPQIVRSGETSLEGLVRDMLRPMLAQWLDENLPGMVERLVKAEIARIAHKQR